MRDAAESAQRHWHTVGTARHPAKQKLGNAASALISGETFTLNGASAAPDIDNDIDIDISDVHQSPRIGSTLRRAILDRSASLTRNGTRSPTGRRA